MTFSKDFFKVLFFGLLVFSFTACQTGISEAVDNSPTPQLDQLTNDETSPCFGQEPEQPFELDDARITNQPSALGTPETVGHLELIPDHSYSVAPLCMCFVTSYALTFDEYPDPVFATYTNNAGVVVNPTLISTVTDLIGTQVVVVGYKVHFNLTDLDEGVYFGFDGGLDPQPNLVNAGGLCMVDNVGAPDPGSEEKATGPWEVVVVDKNGYPSTRYAIPTTMTYRRSR